MAADDDPEARIRDLEQPLADSASEPPATSPTWSNDIPVAAPSSPAAGRDRRWVSVIQFAGGLFLIAGAALAYLLFGRGTEPVVDGTAISAQDTPTAQQPAPAPQHPAAPSTPTPSRAPAAPQESLSVTGVQTSRTLACNNGVVEVSGVSNTVVITGNCRKLSVSGVGNIVTVDSAEVIEAAGLNNRITFHTGSPQIDESGMSNTVEPG